MPPKVKITKEDIVNTAMEIVRESGESSLNARTVASILKCSTQPIFSNFANMDELSFAVIAKASALFDDYIRKEIKSGEYPEYKASGMAYIRFAKEEREFFKLLFMRDRTDETIPESDPLNTKMESYVQDYTGLDSQNAKLFHLEMWAYVHGIATMMATRYINLEWELVSKIVTDAYQAHRKLYGME